ncbi:hypothetical protein CEXT_551281 [Caerostris extrusa]|uniref:Uncharacterized protein n=1 Tax=Caerostris extrusa TaxID=172846 RepID=A0AAV4UA93_CAEEX|nr:hypothetical protein CEXT_551281 [Caerostris extrusa]
MELRDGMCNEVWLFLPNLLKFRRGKVRMDLLKLYLNSGSSLLRFRGLIFELVEIIPEANEQARRKGYVFAYEKNMRKHDVGKSVNQFENEFEGPDLDRFFLTILNQTNQKGFSDYLNHRKLPYELISFARA